MQQKEFSGISEAATYGIGSGIGFFLAILAIAAIREKITYSNVPAPLRGLGITFENVSIILNTSGLAETGRRDISKMGPSIDDSFTPVSVRPAIKT